MKTFLLLVDEQPADLSKELKFGCIPYVIFWNMYMHLLKCESFIIGSTLYVKF